MNGHCTQCGGTGKIKPNGARNPIACLHCGATGIEPVEQATSGKRIGRLHAYPGLKRDLMITGGLVIALIIINGIF